MRFFLPPSMQREELVELIRKYLAESERIARTLKAVSLHADELKAIEDQLRAGGKSMGLGEVVEAPTDYGVLAKGTGDVARAISWKSELAKNHYAKLATKLKVPTEF